MLSNDEVKQRIKNVFSDEYDLSKVNHVNSKTKINLVCKKHGDFWVLPDNLFRGEGCPICGREKASEKKRMKLDEVKHLCEAIHNGKYDYSLITEYKNNRTKYPIICHEIGEDGKEHGVFYQDMSHHIYRKAGCPACAGNKKLTREEIIEKAIKVHGDKYDYSLFNPKSTHSKSTIICKEHGEFNMTPHDHIDGKQGCPKCRYIRLWDTRGRLTVDDVKKRFKEVHGDKYDYSLFTEYKNNRTKIPIICKEHGVFYMASNFHINGNGCPACGKLTNAKKRKLDVEEVIRRIKEVHGNNFIIPEDFEYVNNSTKVKLICKKHGEFWQVPFFLWKGVGCPKCNMSKLEREIFLFLKENNIKFETEKRFPWLKNYRLDFYLPEYNVAIECQGNQHFRSMEFFGGDEQYKIQIRCDNEKRKLCTENGVNIFYFSHNKPKEIDYKLFTSKEELLKEIKEYTGNIL